MADRQKDRQTDRKKDRAGMSAFFVARGMEEGYKDKIENSTQHPLKVAQARTFTLCVG